MHPYDIDIEGNTLTGVDIESALPISSQEHPQVALGDSDSAAKAMHNETIVFDPPPNRARADPESFRCFGD